MRRARPPPRVLLVVELRHVNGQLLERRAHEGATSARIDTMLDWPQGDGTSIVYTDTRDLRLVTVAELVAE